MPSTQHSTRPVDCQAGGGMSIYSLSGATEGLLPVSRVLWLVLIFHFQTDQTGGPEKVAELPAWPLGGGRELAGPGSV